MRETNDGFRIADEDLRLRGPGDVLGTQQSGEPTFRFVELGTHDDLLDDARDLSRTMSENFERHGEAINLLLHLFEHHDAIERMAAG